MSPAIQPCLINSDSACQKRLQFAGPENVAASFGQLSRPLKTKTRHGCLTAVLRKLVSRAFGETFTEPAIVRFRKHGNDSDFVLRQAWV